MGSSLHHLHLCVHRDKEKNLILSLSIVWDFHKFSERFCLSLKIVRELRLRLALKLGTCQVWII